MIFMRYLLFLVIVVLGIVRLRVTIFQFSFPGNFIERDITQIYLMARAVLSGINPYLPLNQLVEMTFGGFPYFPHPAPYPPFAIIFFLPLSFLGVNAFTLVWYILEIIFLAVTAGLFSILWKGRLDWKIALLLFFLLLAWNPVMIDLSIGQLSISLMLLLLLALFASQRDHKAIAGVIIGFTIALKVITWPLIIYFLLKKDWRTSISAVITTAGLNLIALMIVGTGPFLDYYLHVSSQVVSFYQAEFANYSLWSIGFRLFSGTSTHVFTNAFITPPLVNFPEISPYVSSLIVIILFVFGLLYALRSQNLDQSYAIMICVILTASPIVWEHYYMLLIISILVLFRYLVDQHFPTSSTILLFLVGCLMFLFNDQIAEITNTLNGGAGVQSMQRMPITFISSLLAWVPMLELVVLSILLWKNSYTKRQPKVNTGLLSPDSE